MSKNSLIKNPVIIAAIISAIAIVLAAIISSSVAFFSNTKHNRSNNDPSLSITDSSNISEKVDINKKVSNLNNVNGNLLFFGDNVHYNNSSTTIGINQKNNSPEILSTNYKKLFIITLILSYIIIIICYRYFMTKKNVRIRLIIIFIIPMIIIQSAVAYFIYQKMNAPENESHIKLNISQKKQDQLLHNDNKITTYVKNSNTTDSTVDLDKVQDNSIIKANQENAKKNGRGSYFELNRHSKEISGRVKVFGLKENVNYILSIVGYPDHPSNDILKENYSTTFDNLLGYCDLENVESNKKGNIDVSFKKSLPPGKYKVKFLLKDANDVNFERLINENVSFVIQQITYTKIEVSIFLFEKMALKTIEFDISIDNNCSSLSGIPNNPKYLINFPVNPSQPQTLHFVVSPHDKNQHVAQEGVLFKFEMRLEIDCIERDIYITNSYINGFETKNIGFFQNNEYSHIFSLKHE